MSRISFSYAIDLAYYILRIFITLKDAITTRLLTLRQRIITEPY